MSQINDAAQNTTAAPVAAVAPVDPEVEKLRLQLQIAEARAREAEASKGQGGFNLFSPEQAGALAKAAGETANTVVSSLWGIGTQFLAGFIGGGQPPKQG